MKLIKYELVGYLDCGGGKHNYGDPIIKGKLKYKWILIKKLNIIEE